MLYEPLLREAEVEEKGQSKRPEPVAEEDRAGWLSQMAFGWLTPTIRHGYRRRLEPVDALNVPQRYSHQQNFAAFRVAWARNAHRRHARGAFSSRVSHSVWCVVGRHFAVSILAIMLSLAADFSNVYFVNRLIAYLESYDNDDDLPSLSNGLAWTGALILSMSFNAVIRAHAMYWCK